MESNDHDILIGLKTSVDALIKGQSDFFGRYSMEHTALVSRVTVLENQDSRDSERFKNLTEEIRRSLNNAAKIDTLAADVKNMGDAIRDLKAKSNLWDIANAIGVAIASALAWIGLKP
jgi:uncharacterized protein YoxC